jgi:hypothetical protein
MDVLAVVTVAGRENVVYHAKCELDCVFLCRANFRSMTNQTYATFCLELGLHGIAYRRTMNTIIIRNGVIRKTKPFVRFRPARLV